MRIEALKKVENILNKNETVTYNLSKLPPILAQHLVVSSNTIVAPAIAICMSLGKVMGTECKHHVLTLFPGMLQVLGNNKVRNFIVIVKF